MTCIVGLVHGGVVYLAGDSAEQTDNERWECEPKVWRSGDFIMGMTAETSRAGNIARYAFTPPLIGPDKDLMEYMVTQFVDALRGALKDGGHTKVDNGREEHGLQLLVGVRGRLFSVWSDCTVTETRNRPFQAIGCGSPYALGYMAAMAPNDPNPAEFIKRAIKVAAAFAPSVGGPVTVIVSEARAA